MNSIAPDTRSLARYECEGCRHHTPLGSQVLLVMPIIDKAHAGEWPDFYTAKINWLALCHVCARRTTAPNENVAMKVRRARRALDAWKTFDRIPDDRQWPGCDK